MNFKSNYGWICSVKILTDVVEMYVLSYVFVIHLSKIIFKITTFGRFCCCLLFLFIFLFLFCFVRYWLGSFNFIHLSITGRVILKTMIYRYYGILVTQNIFSRSCFKCAIIPNAGETLLIMRQSRKKRNMVCEGRSPIILRKLKMRGISVDQ